MKKAETIWKGQGNRARFRCSNPNCEEPIRQDKWDTHVIKATTDLWGSQRVVLQKVGRIISQPPLSLLKV